MDERRRWPPASGAPASRRHDCGGAAGPEHSQRHDHRTTLSATTHRLGWRDAVTGALTAALLVVTFLPWGRSGERSRSSYELVDVAGSAGVLSDSVDQLAPLWYLIPIGGAFVFICGFWVARRSAGAILATVGASVSVFAFLVLRSPLIPTSGCRAAIVVGTGAVLWGVGLLVRPRRTRTGQR